MANPDWPLITPARRAFVRWSQIVLYSAAGLLICAGAGSYALRHLTAPGGRITGRVLPELQPAERLAAEPGSLADWNLLLVTLDTTRADHLGCYGNTAVQTPTLDGLARQGVLCANAVTTVPATLPAHASLLTGLYPFNHGARANGTFRLEEPIHTLAEVLRTQGWRTAAAVSAYVLDEAYGLNQGFELYLDDLTKGVKHAPEMYRERPAELANEAIFPWIREHAAEKFFCWVHYFDAHAPYAPPEPYRSRYTANPYDGEIAYADEQLGRLLDLLSELGVRERTLVVVTADHGEGLGEHGEQTHSLLIYDSTMRVPLIWSAPAALPRGQVLSRQVSLVDVAPTVLALLGLSDQLETDGISLLAPGPVGPRACYVETLSSKTLHGWAPLLGVRRDDCKFILAPRPEIYDLARDPGELHNLYATRPELAVDLHEALKGFVGEDPLLAADVHQNLEMDEESLQKLAALGYVTTTRHDDSPGGPAVDPKDGIIRWERVQKATQQRDAGDIAGAITSLEACVADVPGDVWARQILAGAYQTQGRMTEALAMLEETERISPPDPAIMLGLAALHGQVGNLVAAEEKINEVLALQPDHSGAYQQLAHLATLRQDEAEALRLLHRALELDRGTRKPDILTTLADLHLQRGRRAEARAAFEQALEVDAFNGEAHGGLAEILLAEGHTDEALAQLQQAIRFDARQPRPLTVLGSIHTDAGRYDQAIQVCRRAVDIKPSFGPAWVNLGVAYRRQGDLAQAEAIYRQGLEKCPGFDALHQNLAQILYKQDRADEAFEEFKIAAQLNPYNVVALANVGVFHLRAERYDLAARCFRRALRAKPDDAFTHRQLGVLLLKQNRLAAGLQHLERSLALDPQQPDAGFIRFQLDSYRHSAASQPGEAPSELEEYDDDGSTTDPLEGEDAQP